MGKTPFVVDCIFQKLSQQYFWFHMLLQNVSHHFQLGRGCICFDQNCIANMILVTSKTRSKGYIVSAWLSLGILSIGNQLQCCEEAKVKWRVICTQFPLTTLLRCPLIASINCEMCASLTMLTSLSVQATLAGTEWSRDQLSLFPSHGPIAHYEQNKYFCCFKPLDLRCFLMHKYIAGTKSTYLNFCSFQ